MLSTRSWRAALVWTLLGISAACGSDEAGGGVGSETTAADSDEVSGTVLVFAAASLTDAFAEVASAFETANPNADVQLNLAGSSALRVQILEGAPADVFAPANEWNMGQVVEAGEVAGEPEIFVHNLLQIVVPAGNPAGVSGLDDFANKELLIGLCAEGVPCGDFGRQVLANAGIEPALDTNEPDVRSLLTKIEVGELDAGLVYVTDVTAAGDLVEGIDIPAEHNIEANYPIAVLVNAPNPDGAATLVELVLSSEGQEILANYGFSAP